MPVLVGLKLALEPAEFKRRALGPRGQGFEEVLGEALREAQSLAEPRVAYEVLGVEEVGERRMVLEGDWVIELEAQSPCFDLRGVQKVAALAGTIGPRLEERVSELFSRGERLKAVVLDGVGSAMVDSLMDVAWEKIGEMASEEGLDLSGPLSPGMPGLPIELQRKVVERVPAGAIGLGITRGGMLVPRKSFTCLILMGKGLPRWEKGEMCKLCPLRDSCPYRRVG